MLLPALAWRRTNRFIGCDHCKSRRRARRSASLVSSDMRGFFPDFSHGIHTELRCTGIHGRERCPAITDEATFLRWTMRRPKELLLEMPFFPD
jgi:hypothetical protein